MSLKLTVKRLISSHFVRNVILVGGGIAIGHAIVLAFMPFLTRLYGPDAFGVAASFSAVANIAIPLATFGYAAAIVLPESDKKAAAIARLSMLFGLTISLASLAFIYLFNYRLAVSVGLEQTPHVLYLIPVLLIVSALLSVANQSAIRAYLFKVKARAKIESTLVSNIAKFIGGLIAPSGLLLVFLSLVEQVINFILQVVRTPRGSELRVTNWFGLKGVRAAAISQRDFAIYRMPQSLLNAVSTNLPIILLSTFFGVSSAGQYSLAVMALGAPAMLIGQAIGEVFYPKVTRAINAKSLETPQLLSKVTTALFILGLTPFGIVFLWGSEIFTLVFGLDWERSGLYAQWISLWLLAVLTAGASVSALPALRLQRFLLINEVISVCLRLAAFYIGFYIYNSDVIAVALFCLVNVLLNISIIYVAHMRIYLECKRW